MDLKKYLDPAPSAFEAIRSFQASLSATDALRERLESASSIAAKLAEEHTTVNSTIAKFLQQQESASAMAARLWAEQSSALRVSALVEQQSVAASIGKQLERLRAATTLATEPALEAFARLDQARSLAAGAVLPGDRWLEELSGGAALRRAAQLAQEWQAPFEEMRRSFEKFEASISSRTALSILDSLEDTSFKAFLRDFDSSDGSATLGDVERRDAEESVRRFAEQASTQATPEAALTQILEAIEKVPDTKLQKMLWVVLVPVLLMLMTLALAPVTDFYIKKALEGPKQEAKKQVVEAAAATVGDLRLLADYRYVSAKSLVVRVNPSARSPEVAVLRFGQTVRVLKKQKDFTLVQWTTPDASAQVQGWVFSRYLNRFE